MKKTSTTFLYDMNLGNVLSATVKVEDDGMVVVDYPHGVCRLESRQLIEK